MSKLMTMITHGNVDKDFYITNISQLRERNVKMLKLAFSCSTAIAIALYIFSLTAPYISELETFYAFFALWFIVWEILTFAFLDKHHQYAKLFYGIFSGTVLVMTAITSTLYAKDINAVIYFIFLIFIPGMYINKPTCCLTTTILSGIIFSGMILYFKTDPYIIQVDIINTVFSVIIGIAYNLYIINLQLLNLDASIILKQQSTTDELTALPNRRCFNKFIEENFDVKQDENLSIIMMDIDFFKKYNDTYGHLKGDECLSLIGRSLIATAQHYDIFVARYGGEEFVAVIKNQDKEKIERISNDFIRDIESLQIVNQESMYGHITMSAGYACYPGCDAKNYMQLINYADEALYNAKRTGRNKIYQYKKKD